MKIDNFNKTGLPFEKVSAIIVRGFMYDDCVHLISRADDTCDNKESHNYGNLCTDVIEETGYCKTYHQF